MCFPPFLVWRKVDILSFSKWQMGGNNAGPSTAARKMGTSDNGTSELYVLWQGHGHSGFCCPCSQALIKLLLEKMKGERGPPHLEGSAAQQAHRRRKEEKESSGPKTPSDTTFQSNRHKLAASSHKTQQGSRTDTDRRVLRFCLSTCCHIVFTIKRIREGNAFSEQGS